MNSSPQPIDPSVLLADSRWMRSLAAQLVRGDPSVVDDLVQEALLVAIERRVPPTRPWMGTVMRNLARLRFRSQARRRDREVFANEVREVPSPSELTARMDLHRQLADAVLRLREPFRETVLLRFNEELRPQEIAEHLGVSAGTVRSRLKRGLDMLREDLDARHGADGHSWAMALLPLLRGYPGDVERTSLAFHAAAIGGLMVVGLVLVGSWLGYRGQDRTTALGHGELQELVGADAQRLPSSPTESAQRIPLRSEPEVASASQPQVLRVAGRVFDATGQPLAAVGIGFVPIEARSSNHPVVEVGRSDDDGRFQVELPAHCGVLRVLDERWTTLLDSTVWPGLESRVPVLVAAPRSHFNALVQDSSGQPIAGATLGFQLPDDFRRDYPRRLSTSNRSRRARRSDEAGRVTWDELPLVEGGRLWVRASGFQARRFSLSGSSEREVPIVLERRALTASSLSGQVLDDQGIPASGARVIAGQQVTTTDRDGRFAFTHSDLQQELNVHAIAAGSTATHRLVPKRAGAVEITLQLGPAPETLAGFVVDPQGGPVEGARVFLADPTFLGRDLDGSPLYAESLALEGAPFPWQEAHSRADGSFELEGLEDRDYSLVILGPDELRRITSGPWRAGDRGVRLVLEPFGANPWTGVLRDVRGEPVPGASLWLERTTVELPYDTPRALDATPISESVRVREGGGERVHVIEPRHSSLRRRVGSVVRSDSRGRFHFDAIPDDGEVYLRAWTNGSIEEEWRLDTNSSPTEWTLRGERRIQLERRGDGPTFDRYYVTDALGERLQLLRSDGDVVLRLRSGSFSGARSEVYSVAEEAAYLVLESEGLEVGRVPLVLERDRVSVVTP